MKEELFVITKKFLCTILIILTICSCVTPMVSIVYASVAGSYDGTNAYDINNNRVNLNGPSNPQKVADLSAVNSEGNPNPAGNPVNVDGTAYNRFGVYSNGSNIIQSDNKYSYSFIPNKNTTVSFWNESDEEDGNILISSTNKEINVVPSHNNQSGKIGCYIKNLGLYIDENSEINEISLKCTFYWESFISMNIEQYPLIRLIANPNTKRIIFSFYNQSYKIKFDIYDSDPELGGNLKKINFSTYISDIDGYQFVGLGNFNGEADGGLNGHINEIQSMAGGYIYTDTTPNTTYKNYKWFYSRGGDRYNLLQDTIRVELDNVNSFEMVYGCPNDYPSFNYGDRMYKLYPIEPTRDEIIQRIRDKRQNAGITFSGESYVRYDIENPVEKIDDVNQKNVESNQVGIDEEFYYKIYHRVPDENSAFYYNSYTMETILPEGVEYQEANVYKSYGNDDNENTINSEDFEINYDETTRKVTAVAKNVRTESFYNEIYMLKIKIKLQKDNIQDITENSEETIKTYLLNNHSTVRVNRNNNQTNMNLIDGSTYTIHPIDKDNNNNLITRTDYAIQLNSGAIELGQYVNTYSSQKFIIKYEGSGYYSFRKGNSALTSDTNNVGKLRTASYTLDENDHIVNDKQLWRIMKAGDFYIISPKVYNGLSSVEKWALTANNGEYTNGGLLNIQFIPENYTDNIYQLFSLERVDTDAVSSTDMVLETNEVNTTYYEKKIDVTKQWNDDSNNLGTRPESINFTVSDGNTVVDSGTITADGTNSQTVKTKYLPILNNLEQVIDYQVSENDITGYTPNYTTTKDEDGVSLLKIDNNLNEYEYRVEYYYDEVIDNSKTVIGTAKYNDVISSYTAKNKTGFVFDRDVGKPLTIGTDETANVIKVYYRRRTDLKGTVNYYLDGTTQKLIDSKNLTGLRYQDVLQASSYREEIEGYTYTRANPASITVKTSASSNVLNLYYTPNNYNYTVEYYYNNVRDDSKTDTLSAAFNSTIETVEDKVTEGYRHDRTETLPFTITSNPDNNIIRVYYVTDDGNTKNLKYTVEYYKNGIKQTADTQVVNKTVQVLEPDTLAVDFTKINTTNKYVGYRFDHSTPSTIPETVPTNTVIKIYYVKRTDLAGTVNHYLEGTTIKVADSENLNNLEFEQVLNASDYIQNIPGHTYTGADPATITVGTDSEQNVLNLYYAINRYDYSVEYYYNGVQDTDAKETYSADYNSEITEYTDKNKPGFKLDRAEPVPLVIGENETENVLRVYYITDPTQKKSLHYTVEYYKDGTIVNADTQVESIEVQYLEPDTLTVDQSKINIENKYVGYRFDHSNPATIPSTVNTGDVIKIYYVKRTDLTGKVNYYLKGTTTRVRNPITLTGLQFQQVKKASSYKKTVTGYTYDSANPTSITVGVDPEQNVLNLYYTKNIYEYTVEYYYNNIKDEDATEHGEAEYKSKITTYIDKPKAGYMFSSVESLPLTITANSENNVIKVYYVTDDGQTKPLSYTVEYYKDGVKQTEDTQTESITVQYLEPNTLTVDKTKINTENKYEGYVFSHTDPASIPETVNNGDVIKVYYVKRQDLTGTVNHYLQGTTTRVAPTETLENLEFEQVVSAADHIANIEGYTYVGASPTSITIGVDSEQNVLNLYYTINSYGYTVEYYYNNVKDNSKTINGTADYNTVIETVPDKNKTGYKHDRTTNLPLTIGTNPNNNIIKVYYVTDDGQTKTISYTVEQIHKLNQ